MSYWISHYLEAVDGSNIIELLKNKGALYEREKVNRLGEPYTEVCVDMRTDKILCSSIRNNCLPDFDKTYSDCHLMSEEEYLSARKEIEDLTYEPYYTYTLRRFAGDKDSSINWISNYYPAIEVANFISKLYSDKVFCYSYSGERDNRVYQTFLKNTEAVLKDGTPLLGAIYDVNNNLIRKESDGTYTVSLKIGEEWAKLKGITENQISEVRQYGNSVYSDIAFNTKKVALHFKDRTEIKTTHDINVLLEESKRNFVSIIHQPITVTGIDPENVTTFRDRYDRSDVFIIKFNTDISPIGYASVAFKGAPNNTPVVYDRLSNTYSVTFTDPAVMRNCRTTNNVDDEIRLSGRDIAKCLEMDKEEVEEIER